MQIYIALHISDIVLLIFLCIIMLLKNITYDIKPFMGIYFNFESQMKSQTDCINVFLVNAKVLCSVYGFID